MKYTLFVHTDRINFLLEMLKDKIKIIKQEVENGLHWIKLEITIEDSIDLMHVFHAGCQTGMANALNKN